MGAAPILSRYWSLISHGAEASIYDLQALKRAMFGRISIRTADCWLHDADRVASKHNRQPRLSPIIIV